MIFRDFPTQPFCKGQGIHHLQAETYDLPGNPPEMVGFPGFGNGFGSPCEIGKKTYGELRIFNLLGGVS